MNKKLLAMLTVLAMLISLTACGASKSESTASETSTVVTAEENVTEESAQEETVSELEDVPATAVEEQTIADMIGSTVIFGSYEQDNDTVNGAEDIEWIVLDQNGNNVLLFSKYALDTIPYNNENAGVTWETCTLRSWLNGEFYTTAFSEKEQDRIQITTVTAEKNPEYDTDPGADTQDKVFLLSISEAERYFSSDEARKGVPTAQAFENKENKKNSDSCFCWLRSIGCDNNYAADIDDDGTVDSFGNSVDGRNICVRPAMWVNLASLGDATTDAQEEKEKLAGAELGSTVFFGAYEQDTDKINGAEEIEWLVLDRDGDKVLLISKYALDVKPYNEELTDVTWETCTLRSWLNDEFYTTAFSAEEQEVIETTTVTADSNPDYSTSPGNDTLDKIFLLSIFETEKYFTTDEARKCVFTAYAKTNGALAFGGETTEGKTGNWWLRSPGFSSDDVAYVFDDGSVSTYGDYVTYDDYCVRPAMWVNLAS